MMAQHHANNVRPLPLALLTNQRCTLAEVDLRRLSRANLHPAERNRATFSEPSDVTPNAGIARLKAVVGDQILIDSLGR
jgi:hypothetical protein